MKFLTKTAYLSMVCLLAHVQASDELTFGQIVLNLDSNKNVQIAPLSSANNLLVNLAQKTIAADTAKTGSSVVGTSVSVTALSGEIQGLSSDLLAKVNGGASVIFVLNSSNLASLPTSGLLYRTDTLGLDADTLAASQADMNTQVFSWLSSIVQYGSSWKNSNPVVTILTSDSAQCPNNKICFYASELDSIQAQLKTAGTSMQSALYSIVMQKSAQGASASTTPAQPVVYAALLKLISLYLYTKVPAANKQNFSLPTCSVYSSYGDISNTIATYNAGVATAQQALQAASNALITCIQNNDGITQSSYCNDNSGDPLCSLPSWSVGAYLSASVNQGTNSCVSQFKAFAQALSGTKSSLLQLYNLVTGYSATLAAAGSIATSSNYLNGFTVNGNQLKSCNNNKGCPGSGTCSVVFGTNASIVPNGGSVNYGQNSAGNPYQQPYNIIAYTNAPKNGAAYQAIAEYDASGNYLGKAVFFDRKNNPLTDSNGNYIQNFWLAGNGTIYDVCPKNQTCAAVVACPTKYTQGSGITSCQMITATSSICTSASTSSAQNCVPLQVDASTIYNTLCLVQGDIAQQIANQSATCTGILSPSDLQTLDQQQEKATSAKLQAAQTQSQGAWSMSSNIALMPILFPLVGMAVEKIKSLILEYKAVGAGAEKLGITRDQYKTLQEEGLGDNYESIKNNAEARGIKDLTFDQMKSAAEVMKTNDLTTAEATTYASLEPQQQASLAESLAKGEKFGLALAKAKSAAARAAYEASGAAESTLKLSVEDISGVTASDFENLSAGDAIKIGDTKFTFNDTFSVEGKTYFELTNEDGTKEWGSFENEEEGTGFETTDEDPRVSEAPTVEAE